MRTPAAIVADLQSLLQTLLDRAALPMGDALSFTELLGELSAAVAGAVRGCVPHQQDRGVNMANPELTVAVETAVHRALADAAQRIVDEFGIKVTFARFEWLDVSNVDGARELCTHISLGTSMTVDKPK